MEPLAESTTQLERPNAVLRAVQLIAASFAIGGLRAVFDLTQKVSGASFFLAILILLVLLGILFFFLSKIAAGRNWARILFLALLVIGLPFAIPAYLQEVKTNLLHGSISFIIAILQLLGTGLLFSKSSNSWFKSRK